MHSDIRNAIARINIRQEGIPGGWWGTGFLVGDGLVLTALHVVADHEKPYLAPHPGEIVLTFPNGSPKATIVEDCWDLKADWILLRCKTPPDTRPLPLAHLRDDGIHWKTFGFPVANPRDGLASSGHIANSEGSLAGNPVFQLFSVEAAAGQGAHVKGFSGSPVVVESGCVGHLRFALMDSGEFSTAGTLYACPIQTVWEAVEQKHPGLLPKPVLIENRTPASEADFRPLHQLPSPPADFVGRAAELAELRAALQPDGVTFTGVQGQGGVGKSALALKFAAEIAGYYRDAQIYLRLHGSSEKPLSAAEAMTHVLRSFNPEAKLPESEDALGDIYRSFLQGKRVLLFFADAASAAQLKPLIPPAGCAMLFTSRRHFTLPGLRLVPLDALAPAEAEALLVAIAPGAQPEAAKIAELCGYLPLALELAARTLAETVDLTPADYVRRLSNEKKRLKNLGGEQGVEASINLSYTLLNSDTRKYWRLLSVFPGTFDAASANAIWEVDPDDEDAVDDAKDTLSRLVQCSMLEWKAATERYRMPALMRDFARAKLDAAESRHASFCHASYYLGFLRFMDDLYSQGGEAVRAALGLFDREWGNIQSGQSWTAAQFDADPEAAALCAEYPFAGNTCASFRMHDREQLRWLDAALAAARLLKDRTSEWLLLTKLSLCRRSMGELAKAIDLSQAALAIARETGHTKGEMIVLGSLGGLYEQLGDLDTASEFYLRQLDLAKESEENSQSASAVANLASTHLKRGDTQRARKYFEDYLTIARLLEDPGMERSALDHLGEVCLSLGEYPRAIELREQALGIARRTGDRSDEGVTLYGLASIYRKMEETDRAIDYIEQSLAISREMGDRYGESCDFGTLGEIYAESGDPVRAIEFYSRSAAISREIENREMESTGLFALGCAHLKNEEPAIAAGHLGRAMVLFREAGDRSNEYDVLRHLGVAFLQMDDLDRTLQCCERRLELARELKDRVRESDALDNLARVCYSRRDPRFIEFLHQRLEIVRELGDEQEELAILRQLQEIYSAAGKSELADNYTELIETLEEQKALQAQMEELKAQMAPKAQKRNSP